MGIFSDTAPRYWAAGLPVIPLMMGEKRPAINAWQKYADEFPSEEDRQIWLDYYADNNMGLPLGPCANLVAIDIDVLAPEIQAIIEKVIPKSPWVRVGRKGSVRVFRYNGHRTVRIRHADGSMIVEILSKGSQIAMPPSIHPDTQLPYTANCELIDVLKDLPELPRNIEDQLRGVLEAAGVKLSSRGSATVTKWVPAGARDSSMVAHAGLLSRGILKGERTLLEALAEINEWCKSFVEKVTGDDIDPEKAQMKVVEFLIRDVKGGRPLPPGWDNGLDEHDREKMGLDFEEEDELWDYERVKAYLHTKYEIHSVGSSERLAAMEYALARIGQNKIMSPLEEEALLRYMSEASGKQVTIAVLKTQLKILRANGIDGTDHTQIAEALLEELQKTGPIKFFGSFFWQYNGSHWEKLPDQSILRVIAKEFGDLPSAKRASDHKGILNVAGNLASTDETGRKIESLADTPMVGINFANGFLTEDFNLLEHDPSLGMTYCLPYRFVPELAGHAPQFNQFLHDVWGHDPDFEDKRQALREAIAATLFNTATRYSRAFCLLGVAHSGKTTMMDIVSGLMPQEAKCSIPPTKWGERFECVNMIGKLINLCGELSESKFIAGDAFKGIVEGAAQSVEYKGRDKFDMHPVLAHWFASNHMPRSQDSSGGFTRRWLIWEFNRSVPADKKIERFHEYILAEEIEAIAAWAVEGILSLKHNHEYTMPSSTLAALDVMANANNTVRTFLKSCSKIARKQDNVVREYDIYQEYRVFCVGTLGVQASQMKTFSSRMKELGTEFGFRQEIRVENEVQVVDYIGLAINRKVK